MGSGRGAAPGIGTLHQTCILLNQIGRPSILAAGKRHWFEIPGSTSVVLLPPPNQRLLAWKCRRPVDKRGRKLVSGTSFIRINDLAEFAGEEFTDVCAMHFDPVNYGEPALERGFFDIKGSDVWNGEPETTFLVYGYPTGLRELGVDDVSGALNDLRVKMTATAGRYSHASSAIGVHAIALERSNTQSSDGLSGGTVFHLGEDARGFYCGFAGVVLRGSEASDILHFMDAQLIRHFFRYNADRLAGS